MSDENNGINQSSEKAAKLIGESIGGLLEIADTQRVYGEPIQHGETIIIPAAEVLSVAAVGTGFGFAPSKEGQGEGAGGGGGGGKAFARPVAAIVASPEGVQILPIIDRTKIALAAISAGGFMLAFAMGIISPRKALRNLRQRD
jgi:uncharacterized spore protein YtfJ